MTSRFSSLVAALVVAGGGLSVEAGTEECRTRLSGDFGRKLEAYYRGSVRTADVKRFTDAVSFGDGELKWRISASAADRWGERCAVWLPIPENPEYELSHSSKNDANVP